MQNNPRGTCATAGPIEDCAPGNGRTPLWADGAGWKRLRVAQRTLVEGLRRHDVLDSGVND